MPESISRVCTTFAYDSGDAGSVYNARERRRLGARRPPRDRFRLRDRRVTSCFSAWSTSIEWSALVSIALRICCRIGLAGSPPLPSIRRSSFIGRCTLPTVSVKWGPTSTCRSIRLVLVRVLAWSAAVVSAVCSASGVRDQTYTPRPIHFRRLPNDVRLASPIMVPFVATLYR